MMPVPDKRFASNSNNRWQVLTIYHILFQAFCMYYFYLICYVIKTDSHGFLLKETEAKNG